MNAEVIKARISQSISVFIRSVDAGYALSQPVYAINWFDTRFMWLYNFYNFLGAFSVKKVGGKPLFKGRVTKVLHGDDDARRDVLLLVRYPTADNFRQLLESRFFQFVSLLRILAVKAFTFGFSRRTDSTNDHLNENTFSAFVVHHYQSKDDIVEQVRSIADGFGVDIYFAGRITALLASGDASEANEDLPCLMDGALLLRAERVDAIVAMVASDEYRQIVDQTSNSFIATMDRLF